MNLKEITLNSMLALANRDITIENMGLGAYIYFLYIEMFKKVPYVMYFVTPSGCNEDFSDIDKFLEQFGFKEVKLDKHEGIDLKKTFSNIIKKFECFTYFYRDEKIIITENFIVANGVIYNSASSIQVDLKECIAKEIKDKANFKYVSIGSNGNYNVKLFPIKDVNVSIEDNYNDDIPYDTIEKYVQSKESSLLLLYGIPGTGKTHIIRKLIKDNPDIDFYWLDSSMFSQINTTAFMDFLFECKNAVFILEDCESVLKDRETNYNTLITPILNISDGMLGDVLNIKFICTFNTDLDNVDSALLRKGRLKLKYEFKNLEKDKVQKLFDKLKINKVATKDMPLCDIFNQENNGVQEKKSIGFNV